MSARPNGQRAEYIGREPCAEQSTGCRDAEENTDDLIARAEAFLEKRNQYRVAAEAEKVEGECRERLSAHGGVAPELAESERDVAGEMARLGHALAPSSGPSDGMRASDICDARYVSALMVSAGSGPKNAKTAPPITGVTRFDAFSDAMRTAIASVERSLPEKYGMLED